MDFAPQNPPSENVTIRSTKHGMVGGILLILLISVGIFFPAQPFRASPINRASPAPTVTPTLFPFREMTVPHLREREYKSSLENLQQSAENSAYTSYLTNYDSDSLRINAQLTQPKGTMPDGGWPAVIFIHGYIPPTLYRTTENYAAYVDYLARNGLVVFKIDLRGHAQSEGEPGGAYYSSDYIIDTLNAYAALQTTSFVNPNRIGLWGHSMAGNVVLRSLAARPEIPAAVIWAGAVYTYEDLREFGIRDNSYRPPSNDFQRQKRRRELFGAHGEFSPDSLFWRQVAPTNYLADLKGAIQTHHAVNDDVVAIGYSRNLAALLNAATISHELHEYQTGGHNISGGSFTLAMQRTIDFLKRYLT